MSGFLRKILILSFCTAVLLAAGLANARTRTYTTDVVVIGVGGSGVSAAVSAAENGAKVIALEKQDVPGGSSNFAEGLFAVDTEEQRKEFIDLTAEEAFKKSMEVNQSYRVNPSMVRMYLKESTNTISWLKSHGVRFEVFRMSAEEPKVWHLVQDYKNAHHGAALITKMVEEAEALGVKIMYGTPGTKLIYENGVVKGVEAVDTRSNKLIINAKAVIIATGGFPDSKEFIKEYTPFDPERVVPFVSLGKTGDGINMAMGIGADTAGFGLMLHPGVQDNGIPPIGNLVAMSWEPLLWVNKYGNRFTDETVVHNFAWAGNAIESQRDSFVWSVFDENEIKYVETEGTRTGVGVLMPVRSRLTGLRKEIEESIAAGSKKIVKATSIEELAKKIDVPAENLNKAVKDYNRIAEYNIDPEFARDADTVHPIVAPNYYAIKVQPYFFVSLGGVRTNTKLEVTDKNDEVIKGLYAAGCDVGGVYGRTYTLWASGSAYSFAATSGRISGKNAAEYVKSN